MPDLPGPTTLHGALVRHTGFLISRIGLVAQKRFSEQMAEVGLTSREWGALSVLDEEGAITQHALCKCIGMDPSSMVSTIDELESKGLVERRRNPHDRRAHALHVTDQGRRTLTLGRNVARAAQEELLAPLNRAERAQLHGLLMRLAEASSELRSPRAESDGAKQAGHRT